MIKRLTLLLIFITSIFSVYSQTYYADITIDVFANGEVSVDGTTDFQGLEGIENSQKYTSKSGEFWSINLSFEETFSDFIYELNLPEGAEITYIQTTPTFRITQEDERVKLIGVGENRELTILVQYTLNGKHSSFFLGYTLSFALLGIIAIGIIVFAVIKRKSKKSLVGEITEENTEEKEEHKEEGFLDDLSKLNLNERQVEIINLLKENGSLTQKELEKMMGIPKSSISRNIQSLSAKQIVEINKKGITNYLSLRK